MSAQQLRWLPQAVLRGPGRAAFREVYSSYILLLLVACVVFGGNGLQPSTVVSFAVTVPVGGLLLLVSWVALSSRAYRAALLDPSWRLLRTFPLRRVPLMVVGSGFVLLVEGPWLTVWTLGAGPGGALVALVTSLLTAWTWIVLSLRVRVQRSSLWVTGSPLFGVTSAFVRTLMRRYSFVLLSGTLLWVAVTALVIAMFQREHENSGAKVDFAVTAVALMMLVTTTASRWLLRDEEERALWVLGTNPGGRWLSVLAPALASMSVAWCFCILCSGVVAAKVGLAPSVAGPLHFPFQTLGLALGRAVFTGGSLSLFAAALQSRLMRRKKSRDAPLRTLTLVVPVVFATVYAHGALQVVVPLVSGMGGIGLLWHNARMAPRRQQVGPI